MNTEMIKMMLFSFEEDLKGNELKETTLEKYRHDMERFMIFTGENLIDRETTVSYREMLLLCYKPGCFGIVAFKTSTINCREREKFVFK